MGGTRKCALIAVGLLIALMGFVLLNSRDDPPPQDADLLPVPVSAAPADNVYPVFLKMNAAPPLSQGERTMLGKALEGKASDESAVSSLIARSGELLALFAQFAHGPVFQDPSDLNTVELRPDAPVPSFFAVVDAARLISLQAGSLLEQGRGPEALEESLGIVDAGRVLLRSRGQFIEPLVGMILVDIGAKRALEVVTKGGLGRARLLDAASRLSAPSNAADGLRYGLRYAYLTQSYIVDHYFELAEKLQPAGTKPLVALWRFVEARSGYLFLPRRTKALYAARFRELIAQAGQPCLTKPPLVVLHPGLAPNMMGRALYSIAMPGYDAPVARRCEADFRLTAAAAAAALQAYRLDHGRFPASLSELTPGYLAAAPSDAFSGAAPLYSADTGEIHSAGKDHDGKPL